MKALVTGAAGFIGSHLVRRLVAEGASVAILLRPTSDTARIADVLPHVHAIRGDLRAVELCEPAVTRFGPDVVFHGAWTGVAGKDRNDPRQIDENVLPTVELARLAARVGARTFIGLGSQAEYGPVNRRCDERTPTQPTTLYGAAKLAAGLLAGRTCADAGVRFAWLRLFSIFGPRDHPDWLLPYLIRTLVAGQRPALTAAEQRWDFLYVEDAVTAIVNTAATDAAAGVFNLGSGVARPLRTVIEQVRDRIDPALTLGFGEVPYRPDQVMHLEADISRLTAATGWTPETPFDHALARTIDYFRDH